MGGQDDRFGQFDAAVGAVDPEGIEEGGPVRADLEAKVIVAEEAMDEAPQAVRVATAEGDEVRSSLRRRGDDVAWRRKFRTF